MGASGGSASSEPSITGVHSSSNPTSVRANRVLPCPRAPSSTTSWPASDARSSCGTTVSENPTMPGHGSRPARNAVSRLSLISALTVRGRYPAARNSPAVRGRSTGGCGSGRDDAGTVPIAGEIRVIRVAEDCADAVTAKTLLPHSPHVDGEVLEVGWVLVCCPSATLAVWSSAWLSGGTASDDVLDALTAWGEAHEVVAHDDAIAEVFDLPVTGRVPATPVGLLGALRRLGAPGG